jgi:hypothetical protein
MTPEMILKGNGLRATSTIVGLLALTGTSENPLGWYPSAETSTV